LIQTAKLNDVDPQVWLADVLARIADHPITGLDALLPWNWKKSQDIALRAAAAAYDTSGGFLCGVAPTTFPTTAS
jgi:hypothetical protein